MGLDTTHDCWHGAYSAFMRWRRKLAEVAGLPPLDFMEGFEGLLETLPLPDYIADLLPIRWECLKPDILHELLRHSDSYGELTADLCGPLADRLEELLPLLPDEEVGGHIGSWRHKTQRFIDGLRRAAAAGEAVEFR